MSHTPIPPDSIAIPVPVPVAVRHLLLINQCICTRTRCTYPACLHLFGTASDFTMYPFSTQNHGDMKNLRDIYMDACFAPLLQKTDFLQEGWRLEHQSLSGRSSPVLFTIITLHNHHHHLVFVIRSERSRVAHRIQGSRLQRDEGSAGKIAGEVVLSSYCLLPCYTPHTTTPNQSDANSIFLTRLQQHMFPGTTYSHVSGGDPPKITDLTYEQLRDFHRRHYHPSNAKFYTYGMLGDGDMKAR